MTILEVDGLIWQESKAFVSYCPELDLSSCGDSVDEARTNLRSAVRPFLEEAEKMGTLSKCSMQARGSRNRLENFTVRINPHGSKSSYVIIRLEAIQKELEMLRRLLEPIEEQKTAKLEGLWKGVEITEGDLDEAERSLFKGAYEFAGD